MNSRNSPLTVHQGVVIAARIVALYFFTLAIANLLSLPGYAASLWHYTATPELYQGIYFKSMYLRDVASSVLRLCLESLLALAFYRVGPRIQRYLMPEDLIETQQT